MALCGIINRATPLCSDNTSIYPNTLLFKKIILKSLHLYKVKTIVLSSSTNQYLEDVHLGNVGNLMDNQHIKISTGNLDLLKTPVNNTFFHLLQLL